MAHMFLFAHHFRDRNGLNMSTLVNPHRAPLRNLSKKLKGIIELEEKAAAGTSLTASQLEKVASKKKVKVELQGFVVLYYTSIYLQF